MRFLSLVCLFSLSASALPLVPSSYTATIGEGQAQGGSFNYFDETGSQLIDSVLGVNDWTANLGNGNAYEWFGWRLANPTITFNFPGPINITSVSLGFNHNEASGIFLPPNLTIGGTPFSIGADDIPNLTRGFLTYNGSWSGSSLTLSLSDTESRWIFLDEVRFEGSRLSGTIPEPSTYALLSAGLLALAALKRRSR